MRADQRKPAWDVAPPKQRDYYAENWNMIVFRASGQLTHDLVARVNGRNRSEMSRIAHRDLARYYSLLRESLGRIRLTEAECDALLGIFDAGAEPLDADVFCYHVDSRCRGILIDDSGLDHDVFLAKLWPLSHLDVWAIMDACQRWWACQHWTDKRQGLISVGLLREESP